MKRLTEIWCEVLLGILFGLLFLCFMIMASGCRTQAHVVERVRVDSVRMFHVEHDSIYIRDSVFMKQAGDTVRIEKWRLQYVERWRHDTLRIATHDTIPQPYEVVREVRYIPKAYKVSMAMLWVVILAAILYIAAKVVIKIYLKR